MAPREVPRDRHELPRDDRKRRRERADHEGVGGIAEPDAPAAVPHVHRRLERPGVELPAAAARPGGGLRGPGGQVHEPVAGGQDHRPARRAREARQRHHEPAPAGRGAVAVTEQAPPPRVGITSRTPAQRRRARRRVAVSKYAAVALLLSPWIVGFALFTAGPMVLSFYYSFTHYDLLNPPHWVGLDNYRFMFGLGTIDGRKQADPYYWQSVKNTLWIIAVAVPLRIFFALGTAMLLTRPKRGVNVYRTVFFMP